MQIIATLSADGLLFVRSMIIAVQTNLYLYITYYIEKYAFFKVVWKKVEFSYAIKTTLICSIMGKLHIFFRIYITSTTYRSCLIMDAPIKHVITWVFAISFSYSVMSRIVNTSSPRHERSRGHATHLGRETPALNSHVVNGIRLCPNIDVAHRQYVLLSDVWSLFLGFT